MEIRIYYNCIDSKCSGKRYIVSKEHTIEYDDHNYNKINQIINDINNLSINEISKKLKIIIIL